MVFDATEMGDLGWALFLMCSWPLGLIFVVTQVAKHQPSFDPKWYVLGPVFFGPPAIVAIGSFYFLEGVERFIPGIVLLVIGGWVAYSLLKPE